MKRNFLTRRLPQQSGVAAYLVAHQTAPPVGWGRADNSHFAGFYTDLGQARARHLAAAQVVAAGHVGHEHAEQRDVVFVPGGHQLHQIRLPATSIVSPQLHLRRVAG